MKLGCGRALALVLGAALLFSTSFADNEGTGYRVESRQRFDGLTVDRFDRYAFQQSVASYFKIDVSLVVINNVYYADGGVNVDYYCYFTSYELAQNAYTVIYQRPTVIYQSAPVFRSTTVVNVNLNQPRSLPYREIPVYQRQRLCNDCDRDGGKRGGGEYYRGGDDDVGRRRGGSGGGYGGGDGSYDGPRRAGPDGGIGGGGGPGGGEGGGPGGGPGGGGFEGGGGGG